MWEEEEEEEEELCVWRAKWRTEERMNGVAVCDGFYVVCGEGGGGEIWSRMVY